ncbi:acetolactate synthase-1/2/3 large subunit [Bacillus sp. TE9106W]|nr:thiamine pyrophosphate-binding protein [Bacillus cereus]
MNKYQYVNIWGLYANKLLEAGIKTIFGMVGDGQGLLEAAYERGEFEVWTARDQRIAVGMAMGYAQKTGKPSVFVTSPGPGLANSAMGILEAFSAAVPMVIVSNGTSRDSRGKAMFQEMDAISFMRPITKWCYRVESPDQALWALQRAFHYAINGKPGPVFIELPDDLIVEDFVENELALSVIPLRSVANPDTIERVAKALEKAERPVFIAGGGCRGKQAEQIFREFADIHSAAVFTTASARGIVDEHAQNSFGLIGLYTVPEAKVLLQEADLVLIVGSQLEETAFMGWNELAMSKTTIQIDIDYESLCRSLTTDYVLLGDAYYTLRELNMRIKSKFINRKAWQQQIQSVKESILNKWLEVDYEAQPVRATLMMLAEQFGADLQLVQDNGLHDMWGYVYPVYAVQPPGRTFVPGEMTALGLPLGVALGTKLATREQPVVAVIGDGSFQMGSSAVVTAVDYGLGITFVILDNGGFSWPRHQQAKLGNQSVGCVFDTKQDWSNLADTAGAFLFRPSNRDELANILARAKRLNLEGKVVIVQLSFDWNQDIPVIVTSHNN